MELRSATATWIEEEGLVPVAKQSSSGDGEDELEEADDLEGDDEEFDPDLDIEDDDFLDDEEDEDA